MGRGRAAMKMWRGISRVVIVAVSAFASPALRAQIDAPAPQVSVSHEVENQRCFACHALPRMGTYLPDERRRLVVPATEPSDRYPDARPELVVPRDALSDSVHAKLACVDCHPKAMTLPHPQEQGPPSCGNCHKTATLDCLLDAHGRAPAGGDHPAPTCASCHGGHDMVAITDVRSPANRKNIAVTCRACHAKEADAYLTSVHGQAVAGEFADPPVHLSAQSPVCSDCHGAHAIASTNTPAFKLDIVRECGSCHDKPRPGSSSALTMYDTYRMSYHGQVTSLGLTRAARCSDCHGAHDVQRIDDPVSKLSAANRLGTCQKCHAQATESFTLFDPHADYHDAARFPLLHGVWWYFILVMSLAFGFFGLHSILWFVRSMIDRIKLGAPPRSPHTGPAIRRFTRVDRINHALIIVSFFGLTLTGLPLLYANKKWGRLLAESLGGPWMAGRLHRCFAVLLIANFAVHIVAVLGRFRGHGVRNMLTGPATLLPRRRDFADCLGMWRWFIAGGKRPEFDRWTYWEKFDYAAEVAGSLIIGITGLMLWFPVFFSRFVPGWTFNVASVVHGYEALLAIGFIFTIHFFNAHVRPEKFPVDDVMFSGNLPEDQFRRERGAEYARLAASGELDSLRVALPPRGYRIMAVILGIAAMAIGTTLVVLIVLAGLKWI